MQWRDGLLPPSLFATPSIHFLPPPWRSLCHMISLLLSPLMLVTSFSLLCSGSSIFLLQLNVVHYYLPSPCPLQCSQSSCSFLMEQRLPLVFLIFVVFVLVFLVILLIVLDPRLHCHTYLALIVMLLLILPLGLFIFVVVV